MHNLVLFLFSICWIAIIYLINRVIAGHPLKINKLQAVQYVTSMAAIGILGEVTIDGFYKLAFNQPLWLYRLYPIHGGYTSVYSLFEWGLLGFYVYLLHEVLRKKFERKMKAFIDDVDNLPDESPKRIDNAN